MREKEIKLLFELLKNSKRSDRASFLLDDTRVYHHTRLEKIGYELTAFTYFGLVGGRLHQYGEGMGMNGVMASMYKDYSDFLNFIAYFRMKWAENLKNMQSFVVTLKTNDLSMIKSFSYSYLAKTEI